MFDSMQNAEIISTLTKEFNEVRERGRKQFSCSLVKMYLKYKACSYRNESLNVVCSLCLSSPYKSSFWN